MIPLSINNIRFILPLFSVLFMLGCSTYQTIHTTIEPQVEGDREYARLITPEEIDIIEPASMGIIATEIVDIIELTSNQFKLLVYSVGLAMEMRLIVPTGEELFIKEPLVEVIDAETQQVLSTFHLNWKILTGYNLAHDFSVAPDFSFVREGKAKLVYEEAQKYIGRLIGLESLPPTTAYSARIALSIDKENEIVLKFPVFRTVGNETIIFEDVAYKVSTNTVTREEWYWDDFLKGIGYFFLAIGQLASPY